MKIDLHKIRDASFRQKLDTKLAEIRRVQEADSFVTYAHNRHLADELEEIYGENLERYEQDYLGGKAALDSFKKELISLKTNLHSIHYQELTENIERAEAFVSQDDYGENSKVFAAVEKLKKDLGFYLKSQQDWGNNIAKHEKVLFDYSGKIWSEDLSEFQQKCEQLKLKSQQQILSANSALVDQASLTEAVKRRTQAVNILKKKNNSKLSKKLDEIENEIYNLKDFKLLEKKYSNQKIIRRLLWATAIIGSLLSIGYTAMNLPRWLSKQSEKEAWEATKLSDNWQSYEHFTIQYPKSQWADSVQEKMLHLDYGSPKGLLDRNSVRFDYEGNLNAARPSGQGKAQFGDGQVYEGAWRNGSFHGKGILRSGDGRFYDGEWNDGLRHGSGSYIDEAGTKYSGEWKRDQMTGSGTMKWRDGSHYAGYFKNGLPDGAAGHFKAGTEAKKDLVFQPNWPKDAQFTGKWRDGIPSGQGTFSLPNGQIYRGNWKQGLQGGRGKLIWSDGSYFEGLWEAGRIQGRGRYVNKFRQEDEGLWNGNPEAIELRDANGNFVKRGKFDNGLFIVI